jgi:hypothetical protein
MSEATQISGLSVKHTYIAFFVVLVSFAHEYGYWGEFHIHFLEHIGFADLPKLAAWPVVATAGAYLLGSAIGMMVSSRQLPPGGGANTPTGIILNRYRKPIGLTMIVLGLCSYSVIRISEYLWVFGPLLIAYGLWIAVDIGSLFNQIGITLRHPLDLLVVFLPCLAFGVGHAEALKIVDGTTYVEARFMNSGPALRYLGRAGDYVFFWNSYDLDTEIHRLESIQPLTLQYKTLGQTASQTNHADSHN